MVSQLFESRFALHKMIYNHKSGQFILIAYCVFPNNVVISAKAVEIMIVDALVLADPSLKLADKTHNAKDYLHLNDSILLEIEKSTCSVCTTTDVVQYSSAYICHVGTYCLANYHPGKSSFIPIMLATFNFLILIENSDETLIQTC